MKSVISDEKRCWVCGTTYQIEKHHIYAGAYRNKSEKYGAFVNLCHFHHQGEGRTGYNNPLPELDKKLKQAAQRELEKRYGHEWFMDQFNRNWLEEDEWN